MTLTPGRHAVTLAAMQRRDISGNVPQGTVSRQARSAARIRKKRRAAGLCAQCGRPSPLYTCHRCRPGKGKTAVIAGAKKAALARWSKPAK
jgi:hypothetical protein